VEIRRTSQASWKGGVESGSGTLAIGRSGTTLPFSLKSRVGDEPASNPEELLGAALAGCYAMSLANELESAGVAFDHVDTRATVHLVQGEGGFGIPVVDLVGTVVGAGESAERIEEIGRKAEASCPVSRLYDADIRLTVSAS
jgi:osmotically inducible protein OsmC